MHIKLKSETVWIDTMPSIITAIGVEDARKPPDVEINLQFDEVLPQGDHEIEVVIKGPDGSERKAVTRMRICHAC